MPTSTSTAAPATTFLFTCANCGGGDLETLLPAYVSTNDPELPVVSVDTEASALSYFCNDCDEDVSVVDMQGKEHRGRW